jgi:LmbE family N-acetylglucosaminyl deacetylase
VDDLEAAPRERSGVIQLSVERVRGPLRILCLGAHCDDVDIGCGASLLRIIAEHGQVEVTWVALCSTPERAAEVRGSARRLLRAARRWEFVAGGLRDGYLPAEWRRAKELVETFKRRPDPHIVFTHCGHDLHQDHRVVSELAWNAFRNHLILEYEIAKYDGDLAAPNVFVPVSRAQLRRKIDILMRSYPSQRAKDWFTADAFAALARLRGIECHARSGVAEAFYARKVTL